MNVADLMFNVFYNVRVRETLRQQSYKIRIEAISVAWQN